MIIIQERKKRNKDSGYNGRHICQSGWWWIEDDEKKN